jgi:hypothetical protein
MAPELSARQGTVMPDTTCERVLRPNRWKVLGLLAVSLGFTATGVGMAADGLWMGWLAAGFFGLGAVVFTVQLLPGSAYLRLGPDGFVVCSLFRSSACRWSDLARFGSVPSAPRGWSSLTSHRTPPAASRSAGWRPH